MIDNIPLQNLSAFEQLQLAVLLTKKALPIWEKFATSQNASFRSTSNGLLIVIERSLLHSTLEEVNNHSRLHYPVGDNSRIHQCYIKFVDPVIAMQDGFWVCSYPVKKIFLAVYFILKSILEQGNTTHNESHLITAISYAIDAIEMSKLYSEEDLVLFIAEYKNLLNRTTF